MTRHVFALAALLAACTLVQARGLLIPVEKTLPPLALVDHKVKIALEDQVAVTRVEQTFRNHTDRPLEATYVFPVPKGASVNRFTMWVDGKETKGELVEAPKARNIYTSIVRRTQDPGLLEYLGTDLLQMKVFPVPAKGDQKVALSYTSVAAREGDLVEYIYPLKTDGKATATLEAFAIEAVIKSQHAVQNVYSPTHAITLKRTNDKEVQVQFEKNQGLLDKDFQLFYQLGDKDVGLTALTHRPLATEPGYILALVTPKVELKSEMRVPRDMVLVLDTSGSMRGPKMEQARKALKYCLDNLDSRDRFALVGFATTVNKYRDTLTGASAEHRAQAAKWVDGLDATGGTAINDALRAALDYRAKDEGRTFTVVFFTDGQPTIGETNPENILKAVADKNTASTRIFTFGVGDDVNATMLDRLADQTRALASYVRPAEDIEAKVSGLYSKISHPVLANLKLASTADVHLTEVYPPALPDLFHGQQLLVLARWTGQGPAALRLTGTVGKEAKEFVYEMTFPEKTGSERGFVEEIWARRKVGYMLDQIRANGEKKELVDEVIALAKRYGITTPYTSYLIVPDGPLPVAAARPGAPAALPGVGGTGTGFGGGGAGIGGGFGGGMGGVFNGGAAGLPALGLKKDADGKAESVARYAQTVNTAPGGQAAGRAGFEAGKYRNVPGEGAGKPADAAEPAAKALREARDKWNAYDEARRALGNRQQNAVQSGKLGVDLSVQMNNLRNQSRVEYSAQRLVQGRNCLEVGGVWIDEAFTAATPMVVIKAQSDAYFRLLERKPQVKEVLQLGNHLVWMTPSGTALVIDTGEGQEKLSDEEIDRLFTAKK